MARLSRESSRVEPSRVQSSQVKLGVEPGVERLGAGGFVLGFGLAIGGIIYECLEHEDVMYASVMFSYRVYMFIFMQVRLSGHLGSGRASGLWV